MNTDKLVKMANQIGTFFEAWPDREQALEGIANHLSKFWDPRMRQALLTHLENSADAGLSGIVRESLETHKSHLV